jgi:polyisoprenoid-binding protein YceI
MRPLPAAALALLIAAAPALAQRPMDMPKAPPGSPDPARAVAGQYRIEPSHTQILFALDHLGFSIFRGFFSQASGTLTLDPKNPAATQLSVTVPVASVYTSSQKLDQELQGPDFFDAQQFPTATFVSTKVTPGQKPQDWATVDGNLTLHGVTLPVQMRVRFHGAGPDMMGKGQAIGFDGRLSLNRSAFGIAKGVPLVSDHVELTVAAAFNQ